MAKIPKRTSRLTPKKLKLSAALICKNEEAVIERCIRSFMDIVDEIIVCDTGSTDGTIEILKKLGVQLYHIEWRDDFAWARNQALSHCTGDWVLYLDADEYFEEGSAAKIRMVLDEAVQPNPNYPYRAISCKLTSIDPKTGVFHSDGMRLFCFKRTPETRFYRRVHEQVWENERTLPNLYLKDVFIKHTGYTIDTGNIMKGKLSRNDQLLLKAVEDGTADSTDYYYLLTKYLQSKEDPPLALHYARQMLAHIHDRPNVLTASLAHQRFLMMAEAMRQNDFPEDEVMAQLQEAAEQYPHHPDVYFALYNICMHFGHVREAVTHMHTALALQADYNDPNLINNFTGALPEAHMMLALHYLRTAEIPSVLDHLFETLRIYPLHATATTALLYAVRNQPEHEIVLMLDSFYQRTDEAHLQYLIKCLCLIRIPKLLLYYTKEWERQFHKEDASVLISYLSLGKYEAAAHLALENLSAHPENDPFWELGVAGVILGDLDALRGNYTALRPESEDAFAIIDAIALEPERPLPEVSESLIPHLCAILVEILLDLPQEQAFALIGNMVLSIGNQDEIIRPILKSFSQRWRPDLTEYLNQALAAQYPGHAHIKDWLHTAFMTALLQGAYQRAAQYSERAKHLGVHKREMDEYLGILAQSGGS